MMSATALQARHSKTDIEFGLVLAVTGATQTVDFHANDKIGQAGSLRSVFSLRKFEKNHT